MADLGEVKRVIQQVMSKDLGRPPAKTDIIWTVGPGDDNSCQKCSVSMPHKGLSAEGTGPSKKEAEAAAGRALLESMEAAGMQMGPPAKKQKTWTGEALPSGPTNFNPSGDPWKMMQSMVDQAGEDPWKLMQLMMGQMQQMGGGGAWGMMGGGAWGGGQKSTLSGKPGQYVTTELGRLKDLIVQAVQKHVKRTLTKEDVVYTVNQEGTDYQVTVAVQCLDLTIVGDQAKSAKAAEEKAAAALVADETFKPLTIGITPKVVADAKMIQSMSGQGQGQKRKSEVLGAPQQVALAALEKAVKCVCHDFFLTGKCDLPEGECEKEHKSPEEFEQETSHIDFTVLEAPKMKVGAKRTAENRAECKELYEKWRSDRAEVGIDPTAKDTTNFEGWYAQVCLVCLCELQLTNWEMHSKGERHKESYRKLGGIKLLPGIERVDPLAVKEPPAADLEIFATTGNWAGFRVLEVGEQDYSFALGLAKCQAKDGGEVNLLATSYLGEHDPDEPEVHVRDDGDRQYYRRKSLPGMDGALLKNISDLTTMGGEVKHSVDATDLEGTLRSQGVEGQFDVIVFPFPRASLKRGLDPRNSWLLRMYFRSIVSAGLLAPGGRVQLLLLPNQYGEWDTACMAHEAGFKYVEHALLPAGFYQSREMSGKPWKPDTLGAGLYVFEEKGEE